MKAVLVKISNSVEKICSNAIEAIDFLLSEKIVINNLTENHLINGFKLIYEGKANYKGGHHYYFSAGNNPGNPVIYLNDITGNISIAQMSPKNVASLVVDVEKELQKKQKDFRLSYIDNCIKGGFNWYYAPAQKRHYPIYEVFTNTSSKTLNELKTELLELCNNLVNKYAKKN